VASLPVGHHQMTETPDATLFAIRDFLRHEPAGHHAADDAERAGQIAAGFDLRALPA
jgi:hypothetical protein